MFQFIKKIINSILKAGATPPFVIPEPPPAEPAVLNTEPVNHTEVKPLPVKKPRGRKPQGTKSATQSTSKTSRSKKPKEV